MESYKTLNEFYNHLKMKAYELGIPFSGGFELTPRCNLRCKMCYVREDPNEPYQKELTASQWIGLGRMFADKGTLSLFLTGGEPLLRDDFREIYEGLNRLGFRITLFTNGTLLTEEKVRWLASIPPGTVDITLYGASEDTYKNLCGSGEAYLKAVNALDMLLKYGINTRVKMTVVKTNVHDFKAVREIARSRRIPFLAGNIIHGHRTNGINPCEKIRLSPEEIYSFDDADFENMDCEPIDIENMKRRHGDLPAMTCLAAKCGFFITWQGHLTPCALFTTPYTEPLKTGLDEAWSSLKDKLPEISKPEKCRSCDKIAFCSACPPRLKLETGRFDLHSEYLCKVAQRKEEYLIKINERLASKAI